MMILINGGSSSGKSGFAETLIVEHSVILSLHVILTQYCVYQPSNIDMKIQNSLRIKRVFQR